MSTTVVTLAKPVQLSSKPGKVNKPQCSGLTAKQERCLLPGEPLLSDKSIGYCGKHKNQSPEFKQPEPEVAPEETIEDKPAPPKATATITQPAPAAKAAPKPGTKAAAKAAAKAAKVPCSANSVTTGEPCKRTADPTEDGSPALCAQHYAVAMKGGSPKGKSKSSGEKCQFQTKKGQCQRSAKIGEVCCWQHIGKGPSVSTGVPAKETGLPTVRVPPKSPPKPAAANLIKNVAKPAASTTITIPKAAAKPAPKAPEPEPEPELQEADPENPEGELEPEQDPELQEVDEENPDEDGEQEN